MYYKVLSYLKDNSKTADDFKDISLYDALDGNGFFIGRWDVDGLAKPTQQDLDDLTTEALVEQKNAMLKLSEKELAARIGNISLAEILATLTDAQIIALNFGPLKTKKTELDTYIQTLTSDELSNLKVNDDIHWT